MKVKCFSKKNNWLANSAFVIFLTCSATNTMGQTNRQLQPIPTNIKQQLFHGNYSQAATQLRLLANKGHATAQYKLALLYLAGNGVSKSERKAFSLLSKSAEKYPKAAYLIAKLYLKKEQTNANRQRIIKHLTMAANAGNKQATKKLNEISSTANGNQFRPQTQSLFELALSSGKLSLVINQYLKGANLEHKNERGDPPIISSIRYNRDDITRWFFKQKVNLNTTSVKKNTPLHLLAKSGKLALIIELAKKLESLDQINQLGNTAILTALLNGHQQTAQWLLDNGANAEINNGQGLSAARYAQENKIMLTKRIDKSRDQNGKIMKSRRKQQKYALKQLKLLSDKKDSAYFKWPQLHIAVAQQQLALTEYLLNLGDSPWEFNPNEQTAIEIAVTKQNSELLDRLLKNAPVSSQSNRNKLSNLLLFLSKEKPSKLSTKLIQSIVKKAVSLNMMGVVNDALLVAIENKNSTVTTQLLTINLIRIDKPHFLASIPFATVDMMKQLLSKDVDLNWSNDEGKSPLIIATQYKNAELVDFILTKNINLDHSDSHGLTALMWSVKRECNRCLTSLLKMKVPTDSISNSGNTALMIASINHAVSLKILLANSHELSQRNNHSLTALMIAVKNRCINCVELLLEAGANPRRKNKIGQDSYDLALTNKDLTTLLERY